MKKTARRPKNDFKKTKSMSQNLSPPEKKIGQWYTKSQKSHNNFSSCNSNLLRKRKKENVHKNETWIFTLDNLG